MKSNWRRAGHAMSSSTFRVLAASDRVGGRIVIVLAVDSSGKEGSLRWQGKRVRPGNCRSRKSSKGAANFSARMVHRTDATPVEARLARGDLGGFAVHRSVPVLVTGPPRWAAAVQGFSPKHWGKTHSPPLCPCFASCEAVARSGGSSATSSMPWIAGRRQALSVSSGVRNSAVNRPPVPGSIAVVGRTRRLSLPVGPVAHP